MALCAAASIAGPAGAAEASHHFPFSFVTGAKAAAAAATAVERPAARFRILNGNVAGDGAWPWQVALLRNSDDTVLNNQYCGGSLITRTWVMTAAHCVFDEGADGQQVQILPDTIRVLAGTNILMAGQGETIPVARIFAHPDYDPVAIENDIALVELAYPPRSPALQPVQLPSKAIEPQIAAAGTAAVVVGWGRLENGEYPVDLRQVDINIIDTAACNTDVLANRTGEAREYFDEVRDYLGVPNSLAEEAWAMLLTGAEQPITENMVCSGGQEAARGSCNGDSGGPLMVMLPNGTYVQVGIVSWSFSSANEATCDVEAKFSAYTRVANYVDWLRGVILAPPTQPMVPVAGAAPQPNPGAPVAGVATQGPAPR